MESKEPDQPRSLPPYNKKVKKVKTTIKPQSIKHFDLKVKDRYAPPFSLIST